MNRPIFDQLNIVSADPEASVEFYRRLGIDIPESAIWATSSGVHHVSATRALNGVEPELEIDSIAFARLWNSGWRGRDDLQGKVVLGFRVESRSAVDALYAELVAAGYKGIQEPHDAFWGSRYAIVEDPDHVAVGLMSPRSAELRSEPPKL